MQVVYGDVLFIINFSMDFLIMYGVGRLLHRKIKLIRLCLCAATGGVYAVFSLIMPRGIVQVLSTVLLSFILCLIAYTPKPVKLYIKTVFLFFAGSVLLGGGVTVCYTFIDSVMPKVYDKIPSKNISPSAFLLICVLCLALSFITGKIFLINKKNRKIKFAVTTESGRCELTLLCDTGNLLKEPMSGLCVVVVNRDKIKDYIPPELSEILRSGDVSLIKTPEEMKKIKIIPSNTVSGSSLLLGFIPKKAAVIEDKEEKETECIVALSPSTFSDCDGVFPHELLQ